MALVELLLSPLPVHVRTARLVTVAAARRAGLEDGLVDELRFAVGEACARAVSLHARHAPDEPVRVVVEDGPLGLAVSVTDRGPAAGPAPDDVADALVSGQDPETDDPVDPDISLALLLGLVDTAEVEAGPEGTTVVLRWSLPVPSRGPGATAVSAT